MTSLSCTILGPLSEATFFTLFLHLCLGLYELVRWGMSLVRKGPNRSSRGERVAKRRLDQQIEHAYLRDWKRMSKKPTREIVETLEKKVCHKEKNVFSTVATERSIRGPHVEPLPRLFVLFSSFCSFFSSNMPGSKTTISTSVSIMGSAFADPLSSEAEPSRGSTSHPMRAKYFP